MDLKDISSKMSPLLIETVRQAKKIIVAVIGFTVLFIGLLLIVLPGPAFIIIPIGLAILATEFVWARKLLKKIENRLKSGMEKLKK